MFLASLVVGCVVAYAFGPKLGLRAAGVTLGVLVVAALIPPLKLYVHLLVAIGVGVAAAQAARKPPHAASKRALDMGKTMWKQWRANKR